MGIIELLKKLNTIRQILEINSRNDRILLDEDYLFAIMFDAIDEIDGLIKELFDYGIQVGEQ